MSEEQNLNPGPQPQLKPRLVSLRLRPYYYDLLEKFMKKYNIKSKSQAIRQMIEDGAKANNI